MKLPSRSLRIGSAVGAAALALALCTTASAAPAPSHHQHSAAGAHSLQPRFGALPAPARPRVHYGTMTFGQITGTTPDYIFPVTPAADLSVYTADFENMMWRPLFWVPNGDAVPTTDWNLSVGEPPKFTDHNKIVTIHMKHIRWSNGQPVTATDVIFDFWMFEGAIKTSAANEGNYTPGLYPDNVASIRALNPTTVRIVFKKTYNQDFLFYTQLGLVEPLPWRAWSQGYQPNHGAHGFENVANAKKIYAVLSKAATSESTYATNRLWKTVDGPWRLSSFTPATGSFSMVPNRRATQHQPYVNKVVFKTFTSLTSEFNALLTNSIDVGPVDFSDLAKVPAIKPHYNVWGYPDFGWQYVPYNFKDHTGHFNAIINQLYIRQALAHLQNEKAVIQSRGIYDGAAYPAYGPVPSIPASPLAPSNATHNPYPFSIKKAGQILRAHGWSVKPGGSTTCVRPGSGKGDCGAGIPAGTPLSWNLVYNPSPASIGLSDEAWASNAKQVGIEMSL
ncbi:MAG: ABC transporter substrate-binding protein, partial [Acidimicrobiales bacterium]